MDSVYWRYFVPILVIVAFMLLISFFSSFKIADQWYQSSYQVRSDPADTIPNAAKALRDSGLEGLRVWLRDKSNIPQGLTFYIVDNEGKDILDRPLPQFINTANRQQLLTNPSYKPGVRPILIDQNGTEYRVFPGPDYVPFSEVLNPSDPRWLLFIGCIAIGAVACFSITRMLVKRIHRLTESAVDLSEGHLDTRVGLHANDELGTLALQFDNMASRIENLVNSRQRMFRNISHEMRSPLARIQMAVELMIKRPEYLTDQAQRIESELAHINHLLTQILNLARLEDPEVSYDLHPIPLMETVEIVLRDAEFEAKSMEKRISTQVDITEVMVMGTHELISSSFENIVRNAIKYSPDNSEIKIHIYPNDDENVIISVIDEGCGVPIEDLADIFDPFQRGKDKAMNESGSGLGLSISRHAITKLGGSVVANNLEPEGFEVKISLPSCE